MAVDYFDELSVEAGRGEAFLAWDVIEPDVIGDWFRRALHEICPAPITTVTPRVDASIDWSRFEAAQASRKATRAALKVGRLPKHKRRKSSIILSDADQARYRSTRSRTRST
jgi:hypothetical protein